MRNLVFLLLLFSISGLISCSSDKKTNHKLIVKEDSFRPSDPIILSTKNGESITWDSLKEEDINRPPLSPYDKSIHSA